MATESKKSYENEFDLPKYSEIPDVGLFLEQVSKYINGYVELFGEPGLTGSMISNYVKKGIIDRPVRKQYSRAQIATLLFIVLAKTVMSLEDIRSMLDLQQQRCDTEQGYVYFRDHFLEIMEAVSEDQAIQRRSEDEDLTVKMAQNIMITIAHKIYLDRNFMNLREQ